MDKTNNLKHLLLLIVLALVGLFTVSCSKDDETNDSPKGCEAIDELVENVEFEIVSDTIITATQMVGAVLDAVGANGDERLELARMVFLKKQQDIADRNGAKGAEMGWRSVCYNYTSIDEHGKEIKLSARVYWGNISGVDISPDYVMLCPHHTLMADAECPTNAETYEAAVLCGDNLLVLPDNIGFGATKDRVQSYVNHNLCAQNSIDALAAGYKVFRKNSIAQLDDNYKLYVVGASQGGGNSLAIHKWLDTHPDIADAWRFAYSYNCAGPYSPAITFREYFRQDILTAPCMIPIALKAMIAAYPDILGKWTEADFYSNDYVENLKDKLDAMIESKRYTTNDVNAVFIERYQQSGETDGIGSPVIHIADILSADALNPESEMCKALFKCLDDNDLTKNWTPIHPIYLVHGTDDTIVPYANAEAVKEAFPDKTTLTNSTLGGGHLLTCLMWMVHVMSRTW